MKKLVMLVLAIAMLALPMMATAATLSGLTALFTQSGNTYTLKENGALPETVIIATGETAVLDLNQKTLNGGTVDPMFEVHGKLTVKNGKMTGIDCFKMKTGGELILESTYEGNAQECIVYSSDGDNNFTVTTSGNLHANGKFCAIQFNGNAVGVTCNITGGMVTSKDVGVYFPSKGSLNISGGTIVGTTAVEVRGGTVKITGNPELVATGNFKIDPNASGTTSTGVALALSPHTTKNEIIANISGGVFSGAEAIYEEDVQNQSPSKVELKVNGGTYDGSITINDATAVLTNLPVDTEIINKGGVVTVNGTKLEKGARMVIPAPVYVDLPQTGDKENLMMWVALLAMSIVGLTANRKLRRN